MLARILEAIMDENPDLPDIPRLTAQVIAAHVGGNKVDANALPPLVWR